MIHVGPHPSVTIPSTTVHELAVATLREKGGAPAVVTGDLSFSGDQLAAAIGAFAQAMRRSGLRSGDTVCLAAPNGADWLVAMIGAFAAGLKVTTASPLMPADMVARQLLGTRPRVILTTADHAPWASAIAESTSSDVYVIDGATAFTSMVTRDEIVGCSPDTIATILSSSGTTGVPKGVMLSHRSLLASAHLVHGATGRLGPDERVLLALPMFHAGGLSVALASLMLGATLVLQTGFEPGAFAAAIEQHRITFVIIVPPIAHAMARHPAFEAADLSSLERVICTAAPLAPGLESELTRKLGPVVGQGYAMTEGLPFTISDPASPTYRPGTAGVAVPNTELRLVDPVTGWDVPMGTSGELWVRGPQLMSGYLDDTTATEAALDSDGWLRTGDLCSIDSLGVVTVEDRIKELIKTNGQQVAPAVVEGVILEVEGVIDCAVIGRAHPIAGEVPVAFLEVSEAFDADLAKRQLSERLPRYMIPTDLVVVGDIPRNPTGKVLRRLLRERDAVGGAPG